MSRTAADGIAALDRHYATPKMKRAGGGDWRGWTEVTLPKPAAFGIQCVTRRARLDYLAIGRNARAEIVEVKASYTDFLRGMMKSRQWELPMRVCDDYSILVTWPWEADTIDALDPWLPKGVGVLRLDEAGKVQRVQVSGCAAMYGGTDAKLLAHLLLRFPGRAL